MHLMLQAEPSLGRELQKLRLLRETSHLERNQQLSFREHLGLAWQPFLQEGSCAVQQLSREHSDVDVQTCRIPIICYKWNRRIISTNLTPHSDGWYLVVGVVEMYFLGSGNVAPHRLARLNRFWTSFHRAPPELHPITSGSRCAAL